LSGDLNIGVLDIEEEEEEYPPTPHPPKKQKQTQSKESGLRDEDVLAPAYPSKKRWNWRKEPKPKSLSQRLEEDLAQIRPQTGPVAGGVPVTPSGALTNQAMPESAPTAGTVASARETLNRYIETWNRVVTLAQCDPREYQNGKIPPAVLQPAFGELIDKICANCQARLVADPEAGKWLNAGWPLKMHPEKQTYKFWECSRPQFAMKLKTFGQESRSEQNRQTAREAKEAIRKEFAEKRQREERERERDREREKTNADQ
jgi:hypothetical protein